MWCEKTLESALNELCPIDHEIVRLRHFEELSNEEAASILHLNPTAAARLYIRAMKHLTRIADELSQGTFQPFATTTVFSATNFSTVSC